MKILVLGGGPSQLPFIEFCLRQGHTVDVLDINPRVCEDRIRHHNLSVIELDISNEAAVLEYARLFLPNAVISPSNDAGLVSATQVAENLKIPGPGYFATKNSRDKFRFRTILQAAGINSPWFFHVKQDESLETIDQAIQNYPCVVKPVVGSGSKGVRLITSRLDLFTYFQNVRSNPNQDRFQIEEFIEGVEFSLEGIVKNGKLYVLAIFQKLRSDYPNLVDVQVIFPPKISLKEELEAAHLANRVVKALQVKDAPIHLEFINSPTRGLVPVECAVRSAGFNLFNKMVPWCTGIDALNAQLNLILDNDLGNISPIKQRAAMLAFPQPKRSGMIKRFNYLSPSVDELGDSSFVEIQIDKAIGENIVPASNGAERIGYIFVFAQTWEEVESIFNKIDFSIELE